MGAKSWEVTDDFWSRVEPLVPPPRPRLADKVYQRKAGAGRKPKPARLVFEAIVYALRTGCQWKALPAERLGSASAIHRRFLEWETAGFFEALWQAGLAEYDEMEGIAWRWQSIDGAMIKAPLAQEAVGPNPTDRGKKGSKRHLLVDGRGVPLSLVVTGANRHDVTQLEAVLDAIQVKRPNPPFRRSKHLCTDAAYRGATALETILAHGYIPHVQGRHDEARQLKRHPHKRARRWVVEVAHSWFNRFRKLLVRYEKLERSFLALNHLAAAIIAFRKVPLTVNIIYG
ncbi:IS5 family transposase (plasmid) [Azotobacter chroococcum]|uniref:IS5 family transposase n=1 Tax=Azotobacter chroococcum TaxID=353 RepID=A0AAQ0C1J9_9GAMM|nr:IS5 family transposase [Azotobacter chroococcum]QQE90416.1 IS5 family transposase [Azotobacter chroococcum]QQE91291.1 IS5 family transposase [Azotobacter chroococcum]